MLNNGTKIRKSEHDRERKLKLCWGTHHDRHVYFHGWKDAEVTFVVTRYVDWLPDAFIVDAVACARLPAKHAMVNKNLAKIGHIAGRTIPWRAEIPMDFAPVIPS